MSRKIDLSAFRGDDSDEETHFAAPPKRTLALNELKSKTFSHGITKKSKKSLEKETEERKRLEEEKAAALVLAEYEGAFEGSGSGIPTGPGRGGFGQMRGRGGFFRAGGAGVPAYEPPRGPGMPPRGPAAMMGFSRPPPPKEPSPPPSAGPQPKGKRAMDMFLNEIKSNQEVRDQRLGYKAKLEGSSVSALAARETGLRSSEQESTNLFVANLPPNVTEETLGLFFAKLGPVGTVKIMWPRGEEDSATRRTKAALQGFVSYMRRGDAEKAVEQYNEMDWGGSVLRVGWSKAVPMPQRAIYDLGNSGQSSSRPSRRRSESLSPSPKRRRSRSDSYSSRSSSGSPPPPKQSAKEKWLDSVDSETTKFIKAVADRVDDHGKGFEDILKNKEKDNPRFAFFFDETLPEYHIYHRRLDSRHRIPTPPPESFNDDGYASLYSSDSAEDSEKERLAKGKLGKLARRRFEALLRGLSGKRVEIARAMEFALKRAEAADDVAEVICQSLRVDDTPVPRKIARLHLVSDILHNSASPLPNVWRYRLSFEQRLSAVFTHLCVVHRSLDAYSGRISADVFRQQIQAVLDIWERWIVFTPDVIESFRGLFAGQSMEETIEIEESAGMDEAEKVNVDDGPKFKTSGFKSSFKPAVPVSDLDDLDGEAMDGEEIDIEEDVDGEVTQAGGDLEREGMKGVEQGEDLDGEAIEDMDGEAMEMDEDLDGEEM